MNVTATFEEEKLVVKVNGVIVRTVTPNNKSSYRFIYKDKEYFFVYDEYNFMNKKKIKRIYLYPVNEFEDNMIEL